MSRFNVGTKQLAAEALEAQKTVNLAGGEAFTQSAELEVASILLTSFVQDQFYRKASDTLDRLRALLPKVRPTFAAKAALYARNTAGMRSITHVVAAEVAARVKGQPWVAPFLSAVFRRPDDMSETVAYYLSRYGKAKEVAGRTRQRPLPNSLKRAIRQALERKFDAYQLAKYRGEGKAIKLVDLVNLTRPSSKVNPALEALMKGTLKATDTWETKLSQAGQTDGDEEQKKTLKGEAWEQLLSDGKLGYLALLRNLRNIIEQAPASVGKAVQRLTDEQAIRKALIFPFQYLKAREEISALGDANRFGVVQAIDRAMDIAMSNVPAFDGRTAVFFDISGSMEGKPAELGWMFAAAIIKANVNSADLYVFNTHARLATVNRAQSLGQVAQDLKRAYPAGGGTNFDVAFQQAHAAYDRIFILSDMQAWVTGRTPRTALEAYKARTGANPRIYSFDLAAYGTLQFPEARVFAVAGLSEKVFELIAALEEDPQALVHRIEQVPLPFSAGIEDVWTLTV